MYLLSGFTESGRCDLLEETDGSDGLIASVYFRSGPISESGIWNSESVIFFVYAGSEVRFSVWDFIYVAYAIPTVTLRKRDGDAPCPVPMVCDGWPLPQLGVPQSVQLSGPQIASQEFQNSVVMPL